MDRKVVIAAIVAALVLVLGFLPVLGLAVLSGLLGAEMKQAGQAAAQECVQADPAGLLPGEAGQGTVLPVKGSFTYTSPFGMRMHPVLHVMRMHAGMDMATMPSGGAVLAARAGKVQATKANNGSAGNMLVLDHGGGLTTVYMHLERFTVSQGQSVNAGQQIGVEGHSGRGTGNHLHFEVRRNGTPTDPYPWLQAAGIQLPKLGGVGTGSGRIQQDPGAATPAPTAIPQAVAVSTGPATASPSSSALPARIGSYGGEQIRNAALIIQAGRAMKLDDYTISLGLMTAMGESDLINVDRGDRAGPDSRGLFQQRANGAWGSYTDRMNPRIAATNFFRALVAVPGYRMMTPTLAAHAVQRNQDPYHYAPKWPEAVRMMATLTNNPALAQTLGAGDPAVAGAPPCNDPMQGGNLDPTQLPPGPEGDCPVTASPAEKGLQPAALRLLRCGAVKFPKVTTMYGVGGRPGPSDHPSGRAVDFMIEDYKTPAGRAYGYQVAAWMRAHAKELNIKYVIWDMKVWYPGDTEWKPYTRYGPNPSDNLGHRNHVHVSVNS